MNKKILPVMGLIVITAIGAANAKIIGTCPNHYELVFYKAFDNKKLCEKASDPLTYKKKHYSLAPLLPTRCLEDRSLGGSAWYACYHPDIPMQELKSKESK